MHSEARHFLAYCLLVFGEEYYKGKILDVGSFDVNGNNRFYFGEDVEYVGCDTRAGPNVTRVIDVKDIVDELFDVVICTETINKSTDIVPDLWRLCKPGGILVITASGVERGGREDLVPTLKKYGCSVYANDAHKDIYAVGSKEKWRVKEYMYS